jgi:hypothetical protein
MVPAAQREDSAHKRAYVGVQFQWMRERRALDRSFIRSQREAGLENLLSISKSGYSPTCDKRIGA